MMSALAAKTLAAVGVATAGTVAVLHPGVVAGIAVAIAHVPASTHASIVLHWIQTSFASGHHPGSPSGHP